MVLTVSRIPPEAFFLATTLEPELVFMTGLAGGEGARSSQAARAKSRARAGRVSRARCRGEAPGIARPRMGAPLATAPFGLGEDAVEKAVAIARDRRLDAADVDQIAADAQDHWGIIGVSRAPVRPS